MATELTKVVFPTTDYIDLSKYRLLTNNDFDTINVTELNAGDLIVTGVGRFTNGLYGNLTGNASSATQVNNNLKIQLNGGTTEGTNQFTYNGSTAKSLNITKSSIGLGNVENKSSATIRGELTSTNVTGALGFTPLNAALKGANSGVAELDSAGKVPSSQLPSFVDDVLEYASLSNFPTTGESGKIYVAIDTNKTYRWGGSAYAEISPSLALGTTSTTAYYGDKGKVAYDHATETRLTTATASGLYKVASTKEGHIASLTSVVKSDITALGIPGSDTNTTYSLSSSGNNIVLSADGSAQDTITAPYATSAATASKLGSSNVGSATNPIYLASGIATACTYSLNKTVPSDAVFTDRYHTSGSWSGLTYTATANGGAGALAFTLPTGTTSTTIAKGNHTHSFIKTEGDNRSTATTPNDYVDTLIFRGLKNASAIGSPGSYGGYSYLLGLRGWGDSSGGVSHELDFCNDGRIYHRTGATTTWGNWHKLMYTDDTYSGTLTSSQVTTALGYTPSSTDTKNTAGSMDTSSKIYLIGATNQAANPQTYSDNEVYATSGVLTTKSVQIGGGSATMEYSATTKSINFVFAS